MWLPGLPLLSPGTLDHDALLEPSRVVHRPRLPMSRHRCHDPACFECTKSRARSCTRKIRYDTWEGAEHAATEMREKSGRVITRYRCRWCPGWHIGHPTGRALRIASRRLERARRKMLVSASTRVTCR